MENTDIIFDYYYSYEHEMHMKAIYEVIGEKYSDTFVNGKKYTEMVRHGEKPMTSHFSDIKKVHTGKSYC